ncbi:MAG: hypothetical protein A3K19_13885 [Lentisphaerae bacterium RIFOXYB12_FULL_65_16]|nr:MAG: hypothetical protein A3K18_18060 [Lentisphaerae bacterium RIFOXYA12_64_32]OGV94126.1 MAG: hypothetical protein A3K19_13885 [Lentisphaerae bacterium RIFOXYB12_FULL_65_16]
MAVCRDVGGAALPASVPMRFQWTAGSPRVAFLCGAGLALAAAGLLGTLRFPHEARHGGA